MEIQVLILLGLWSAAGVAHSRTHPQRVLFCGPVVWVVTIHRAVKMAFEESQY